ncbi:DNA polymerase III subunit gamma/tau [Psychromonas sp. 14N.309.X.WAT.B.A12]|uniref:DNA polymerase III subunit gamma/tau n=1 Tax=Psychromonas sp. 14N.309.X.WAT.B.A12 TaxID=2998322 RepID=UPI0025B21517|nr:DNA polymerase III subunit gamma/tau [Psychromonas sp. 14N.309.X.WAT.B.A12]MDN2661808.1 DNA polymerase III subunit gamma/tau [Psychromonas sp. 14N.309.X.WAT.B.A12]
MSYQVLARKWRPQTFKEVIGQPHVLTALENGLTQDRVHHAYLFSGTRGVGKTTIARILAKSLNCETGVTATPCGVCANCQDIDQGRFVDLLEIDAASRTKVDDTRELLDNVQYKPAQGRYKVYLIDEVHMLSKHSFNALLKTLEEPPEYVKFLLATTDPQKLPITVLSRCLQFHLKAILPEQIEQQLSAILSHEKATFEQPALRVIAKAADGSMRDALSLTDQALAFGAGHLEYAAVLKMLGTIDQSHLHYLLHYIASGNSPKVFEKIQEFVRLGADFSALHQELASLCHQIALMQLQLNANVTEKTTVQLLAERLTPEEVQLFYQIAVQGFKDYAYAPNGKIALEMTVMRLLAFKPANYVDVDESMMTKAEQVEPITADPIVAQQTVLPTPSAEVTSSIPGNVETKASTSATPISVEPIASPVVEQPVEQQEPKTTPQSAQVITQQVRQPEEPVAAQFVQATPASRQAAPAVTTEQQTIESQPTVQPETANFDLSATNNSRNMLRSHRLKREALKKTEAAAEQPATRSQVQFVASESVSSKSTPAPVESVPKLEAVAPTQSRVDQSNMNQQELPPLDSYHEQPSQQAYDQYQPSEQDYFTDVQTDNYQPQPETSSPYSVPETVPAPQPSTVRDQQVVATPTEVATKLVSNQLATAKPVSADDISGIGTSNNTGTEVTFVIDPNMDVAEVDVSSYVEDKMTDPWFLDIKAMQLVGFEKLLAKSCVMQTKEQHILLSLESAQAHLLNNQSLCEDLTAKLREYYGPQYTVAIEQGEVDGQHTPVQLEKIVFAQYLDNAKSSIKNDPIIQTLVGDYSAKVYENSVVPL